MAKAVCVNGHKRPAGAGEEAGGRQAARKRRKADGGRGPEVSSEAGPGGRGRGVVRERPQGCGRAVGLAYSHLFGGFIAGKSSKTWFTGSPARGLAKESACERWLRFCSEKCGKELVQSARHFHLRNLVEI